MELAPSIHEMNGSYNVIEDVQSFSANEVHALSTPTAVLSVDNC